MLAPTERAPNSRPSPLPSALLGAELCPAVMADDPCEAALGSVDPTGPRNYYRARYYDAKLGRFISEDPVRFIGGVNFYGYVKGDPINNLDPLGWFGFPVTPNPNSPGWCELYWALYAKQIGDPSAGGSGWPYAHCMASCLIATKCSQPQAVVAGFAKELLDTTVCLFTLKKGACHSAFQPSDFQDNFTGATCPNQMNCWQACGGVKGAPERPAGPFGNWMRRFQWGE